MKKNLLLLALITGIGILGGCASQSTDTVNNTAYEAQSLADYSGDDYITVAKGDTMELLLQPSSGNIRWKNTKTGEYYDTTKAESDVTDVKVLSDVIATYFNGKESDKYNSYASMDSYTYGVEADGLTFEEMENGVRFIYHLGSDEVTYKQFPAYISEERMEELVFQYLDDSQISTVKNQYRLTASGVYARKTSADNPLKGLAAPELYKLFYEVGHYSYEELEADCAEYGTEDELPSIQAIDLVVEYTLDGDDLVVNVPTENIVSNEEYPIRSISLLPYFLATDETDGYMFVPDGSGALIYLDNDKLSEYQFSAEYYGGDILVDADTYNSTKVYMSLPVYGMKSGDTAILGIIENGAEIAELSSYLNGYYANIPYSSSSLTFYIRKEQTLAQYVGSTTNYTMKKVSDDYYTGDITVRYKYLDGDEANYTGMAKAYQDYLIEEGQLSQIDAADDASLYVNFLGELDKEKYFLGIPYNSSVALTSFNEAADIVSELSAQGIKNMVVKYSGIVNGGINQRAVETVKVSKRLGGKSGLNYLIETANECGATVFPDVSLQTASTSKSLSKKEKSYAMNGSVAQIYDFDLVRHIVQEDSDFNTYIIAPGYIEDYAAKFAKSYSKLGIDTLSSSDFFTFISADYRNGGNVSMATASQYYTNALESLSDSYAIMLSNPIETTYAYVDYIYSVPYENSGLKVLDASVPFTQMVLEGCMNYSSEYVNTDLDSLKITFLNAIESKSALNFRLMAADTSVLTDTTQEDVFYAEYSLWEDTIADYYNDYNEFYKQVKDAEIVSHEIVDRDNNLRVVTYSNGVKVYINYTDEKTAINGVSVDAYSYVLQK
ncbi:MAG: hypothetical protein E7309_04310 [Butyrivibrio sp.]|nr:hypothetical protein [Butyrivibrio sp.]